MPRLKTLALIGCLLTSKPDENFDGGRAFLFPGRQRSCALRLVPGKTENQAPEKKPVPFRSSGPHSLPRWEVSQRPMRLFPLHHANALKGPCKRAASTSAGHQCKALSRRMRNLLKISICGLRVNAGCVDNRIAPSISSWVIFGRPCGTSISCLDLPRTDGSGYFGRPHARCGETGLL